MSIQGDSFRSIRLAIPTARSMSEDELKVTRRRFLQHSAMASAASAAAYSIALKTDALARADEGLPVAVLSEPDGTLPYEYTEGPP